MHLWSCTRASPAVAYNHMEPLAIVAFVALAAVAVVPACLAVLAYSQSKRDALLFKHLEATQMFGGTPAHLAKMEAEIRQAQMQEEADLQRRKLVLIEQQAAEQTAESVYGS